MIIIIGAGIAGLTCARYLKDKGIEALVIEASDGVGGRVRTDTVDGFKLDRGFQVFLTSYPEARKILNYEDLNFKEIPSGARIRSGDDFFVMPNPLKDIMTAPQALLSPVGGLLDKFKVLQLNLATRDADDPADAGPGLDISTMSFLKEYGYSEQMIDRFFIPFFRGVFLEGKLDTDADFFKFLYSHFAKGQVVVPAEGIQAIPEQLAGHLSADQLRLNTRVEKIEDKSVFLENGEKIEAEQLVVATDARTAEKLLGEEMNVDFNSTICVYFESDTPLELEGEPYLIINSNKDELIDHIFVASDAVPEYAPKGKTLISVNIVGEKEFSEEKIRAELAKWFGPENKWRHLKTYQIPEALPRFLPDSPGRKNLKINDHTYRCGDYNAYPSLNAAMKTGREVAGMLTK